MNILPSQNEVAGFYQTFNCNDVARNAAWRAAFTGIATRMGWSAEIVREWLDSKHGRWLADELYNAKSTEEIEQAILKRPAKCFH